MESIGGPAWAGGAGKAERFCPVCGQGPLVADDCPNRWCRRPDRGFSVAFSVGLHRDWLRRAIVRYKYRGDRRLAEVFAGMVAGHLVAHPTWFEEFDVLTSVPSYTGPGARRPWDPVGDIVAALPDRLPGWDIEPGIVSKRAETPGMAGRSWAERQRIAAGPLRRSLMAQPGAVEGASVLVVDDVFTEGSTLREVARSLREAGAADVAGLVLARPVWRTPVGAGVGPGSGRHSESAG